VLLAGIDEAGYGPTLGPLCHGLCVLRLKEAPPEPDLWALLAGVVSRHPAPDGQLCVDDSKKVYASGDGLQGLAHPVAAFLNAAGHEARAHLPLKTLLPAVELAELESDPWGANGHESANGIALSELPGAQRLVEALTKHALEVCELRGGALSARKFNAHLNACGNKADVSWARVEHLLREAFALAQPGEAVFALVDRQGGRKFYAPKLHALFGDALLSVECETNLDSTYRVEFEGRKIRVAFRQKAESACLAVALASMCAKLVRELSMARLNAYFLAHEAKLKPTAGYPQDALRFLKDTQTLRAKLKIADPAFVRAK